MREEGCLCQDNKKRGNRRTLPGYRFFFVNPEQSDSRLIDRMCLTLQNVVAKAYGRLIVLQLCYVGICLRRVKDYRCAICTDVLKS